MKTQPAGWPKPAAFIHPNILKGDQMRFKYFEFFAGGGMTRAGLGPPWECLYANDFDVGKAATYQANWGPIDTRDIAHVRVENLPPVRADLASASTPCQDLSCAGTRLGLDPGTRSAAFWPFVGLLQQLGEAGRLPRLVMVENVVPPLEDIARMTGALKAVGYRPAAMTIDAAQFLPQSRERLFIIGAAHDVEIPAELIDTRSLSADGAFRWRLPAPPPRTITLSELIDFDAPAADAPAYTENLLRMMTPRHRERVDARLKVGGRHVGTLFRRMRDEPEGRVQRVEVRFDGIAGCLRVTKSGGSSRQRLLLVENGRVRSRAISPRECARLMGLPDTYQLPANTNEALSLAGDGVAVPVVRHLAERLLEPILAAALQLT